MTATFYPYSEEYEVIRVENVDRFYISEDREHYTVHYYDVQRAKGCTRWICLDTHTVVIEQEV